MNPAEQSTEHVFPCCHKQHESSGNGHAASDSMTHVVQSDDAEAISPRSGRILPRAAREAQPDASFWRPHLAVVLFKSFLRTPGCVDIKVARSADVLLPHTTCTLCRHHSRLAPIVLAVRALQVDGQAPVFACVVSEVQVARR